jgi:hypothetical protein
MAYFDPSNASLAASQDENLASLISRLTISPGNATVLSSAIRGSESFSALVVYSDMF